MKKTAAKPEPASPPQATSTVSEPDRAEEASNAQKARQIVRRNVYWALGLGLIPVPVVDLVALTGVQVKMLKQLSDLYGVKFFEDKAKTIVGSLVAGLGGLGLTSLFARSFLKMIPGVGQLVGALGASVFGGALTLAVGNLFTMHYESGGTLLDFDADKMRSHFRKELEKSKGTVKQMHNDKSAPQDIAAP
jgi:uncharacterized protein (DUF697 family)